MPFWDRKAANNLPAYVLQCLLTAVVVFAVMFLLNAKENGAVIGSLGASSFIAFGMPHKKSSGARFLIGGYVVGILSGALCAALARLEFWQAAPAISEHAPAFFGGLAVGLAIFVMVLTNVEHPPAAGVALGLVLNNSDWRTIGIVFAGIVLLAGAKTLLKRFMIDLL